jgi:hypothetical protein
MDRKKDKGTERGNGKEERGKQEGRKRNRKCEMSGGVAGRNVCWWGGEKGNRRGGAVITSPSPVI